MPTHQRLDGFEVALGEILEPPLAVEQGLIRAGSCMITTIITGFLKSCVFGTSRLRQRTGQCDC